tara:strand:- start:114 stop:926 length:813 start_codon:yes stop_codon:yes gene_type:complete
MGHKALKFNTTGAQNTAVGTNALSANTTASSNTAMGYNALAFNTTGTSNTALGISALDANTTGSSNTAIGRDALTSGSGGNNNVGVGYQALNNAGARSANTAVGQSAGSAITSGDNNTLIGRFNGNQDGLDIRTASNRIVISDGSGNIGMYIDNSGNANFDGNVIAYSTSISDPRLKTDIKKVENALDKVNKLSGYTFTYKHDDKRSAGVMADEVESVLPSAVSEQAVPLATGSHEEYKVVQYDQLHALLIEAVKELSAKVEDLENASSK